MYKELEHVIPTGAPFGGAILGLLSVAVDLLGAIGSRSTLNGPLTPLPPHLLAIPQPVPISFALNGPLTLRPSFVRRLSDRA
jgi:hypothetical protein